jgi:hypothetical protein
MGPAGPGEFRDAVRRARALLVERGLLAAAVLHRVGDALALGAEEERAGVWRQARLRRLDGVLPRREGEHQPLAHGECLLAARGGAQVVGEDRGAQ